MEHYPWHKNEEHHNLNENRKSAEVEIKMNEMLEWSDIDFKATIMKMVQLTIVNSLDTKEKIENLSKEIKIIKKKKNHMGITELKHNNKIKTLLDGFICRVGSSELVNLKTEQ